MYILGISSFYHDSSACLFKDGELVFACEEEKFTGIKHDSSFPINTIQYIFGYYNITYDDIEMVCYYEDLNLKLKRVMSNIKKNFFKNIDIKKSEFEDYDVDTPGGGQDWNSMFENNPYKHSYINIVNESQFEKDNLIHITEKTLIPFYYSQFPLIVATHQHIKKTKELYGFDFFEDFFDLSYDNEPNPQKRMRMVIDEIVRVSEKKNQLQGFYQSSKKRFKHNKDIVTSLYDDKTDYNFFQSLINHQ